MKTRSAALLVLFNFWSVAVSGTMLVSNHALCSTTLVDVSFENGSAQDDDESPAPKRAPKPKMEPAELKSLVISLSGQLDANKQVDRDAAEAKLKEIGPAILEFLPAVGEDASPEWRMRVDRVREVVEAQEADEYTLASLINLTGSMTGREAISQISQSSNNPIAFEQLEGLDVLVETDFQEKPFWEALDDVLDQLELTMATAEVESIQLIKRPPDTPLRSAAACYTGVFRIEPLSVEKNLSLLNPATNRLSVTLLLAWEPRLSPVFVRYDVENMEIVCDNGEVIQAVTHQNAEFIPTGSTQILTTLEFALPTRNAKKLQRWTGKLRVSIPGKPVAVEFEKLAEANKSKVTVGELNVTLERARKNRDIYEVLVGVSLASADRSADSFRGWAGTHEAYMLDKNKARIDNVGWSTTRMTGNDIGLSYLFDLEKGFDDCTFVYRAPRTVVEQTVEFSLEDIPLP